LSLVLDASAIVALLAREPTAGDVAKALEDSARDGETILLPPTALWEAVIGLARAGARPAKPTPEQIETAHAAIRSLIETLRIEETTIASDVARFAIEAAARFGLTVGHAAELNFGDCFAYATAKAYRCPLLFVGDDFAKTDIVSVLADPSARVS
jgi:ribonuclease VapC